MTTRTATRQLLRIGVASALIALPALAFDDPLLAFDEAAAKESKFVVVGRVLSADGKTALEGVEMTVSSGMGTLMPVGKATTDKDGRFRLVFGPGFRSAKGIAAIAIVHAGKPGWHGGAHGWPAQFYLSDKPMDPKTVPAKTTNILPGQPSPLEFRMQPAASLSVKIVDGEGKAMPKARLHLTGEILPPGASVIADGRTDTSGVFAVKDVPRNRYRLLMIDESSLERGNLELGSIDFKDAAEYEVHVTVREWARNATDVAFRVTRGPDR